ncbi:MAG TPA: TetR/AcrR family transcriptional regulator [Acidimicrobiia bacterium]|jgi:AcrR family transcriptional regulator
MTAPRTKDDVVRAAGRLFAERGFHGTSMRDLGSAVGLTGSSLYSHVGGKGELLIEVIRTGARLFQALADDVVAMDGTAAERLHRLVVGHVGIVIDHLDEARTFLDEARFLPDAERDAVLAMRNRYEQVYRDLLGEGIGTGEFTGSLDATRVSILLLSMLNAIDRWYRPGGGSGPGEVADSIFELAMDGIR